MFSSYIAFIEKKGTIFILITGYVFKRLIFLILFGETCILWILLK